MPSKPSFLLLATPFLLANACARVVVDGSVEATASGGGAGVSGSSVASTSAATGSGGASGAGASACAGNPPCTSGQCGTILTGFNGSETATWRLNGSAKYDATSQSVVLVPAGVLYTAGTAIYQDSITTDSFDVTFDFRLDTSSGRAEGLAFMIETTSNAAVGAVGGGMGAVGLGGYGVENDLWDSAGCSGDKNDNHVGIDQLGVTCVGQQQYPTPVATSPDLAFDLGDGIWRTEVVHVVDGVASVSIDGAAVTKLQNVALPGFVSGTAYFYGFGAASGGLAARQEIRNVQVIFPAPRCL
jgi:Bacterial lectin